MNWIDLLLEFEGILGTLLGVTLTLFLTQLMKNAGKINVEITNVDITFYNLDRWGESISSPRDTAEYMSLRFIVNLYNSSDIPKPINDIQIEFLDSFNKTVDKANLKDESTIRFVAASHTYDELIYLNIMPKQLERKELFYSVHLKGKDKYKNIKRAKLVYRNDNGKTKKVNII